MKSLLQIYLLICATLLASWQCFAQMPMTGAGVLKAAGGGSWTPQSLSNKFAYYDATLGITLVSTSVVTWADQFNSNNLNTLGGAAYPTFSSTACNASHPGVVSAASDGSSLYTSPNTSLNSTTLSLWMLFQANPSGNGLPLTLAINGSVNSTPSVAFHTDNTPSLYAVSNSVLGNGGANVAFTANVPHLLGLILDGTNAHIYLDSRTEAGSPTSFTAAIGNGSTFFQQYGDNFTTCNLIITTGVMNSTDISNLFTWENANWGTSF